MSVRLLRVYRVGHFQVAYELEDGTLASFRCDKSITDLVLTAWCQEHGFQDASSTTIVAYKACTNYNAVTGISQGPEDFAGQVEERLFALERMMGYDPEERHSGACRHCGAREEHHLPRGHPERVDTPYHDYPTPVWKETSDGEEDEEA